MNALKTWTVSLTVALAALAAASAPAAMAAGPTAHAHDPAAPAKLRLDHGRKWKTDAPLREGMSRIRTLVQAQLDATHAGKATPAHYAALASQLDAEVGRIVADCRLPPEADAVLHVVVAELMAGAETLAGKTAGAAPEQGLLQAAAAVNDYARIFEHRGFRPLKLGH